MEERDKENKISRAVYTQLQDNQAQLTNYLNYIKQKPKNNKILLSFPKHFPSQQKLPFREKKTSTKVKVFLEQYLKLIKEMNNFENESGRKIISKLTLYLQEFPTLKFMVEKTKNMGKYEKKLCLNKFELANQVSDEMIPLFQKIFQKIQMLKKQNQSKKLLQLGQRITHLQNLVESVPKTNLSFSTSPFKMIDQERIQKYLTIEENITRAYKSYGRFSENFHKNHQIFSNINRVYQQINKNKQQTCF